MSMKSLSHCESPIGWLRIEAIDDFITEIKFLDSFENQKGATESGVSGVIKSCKKQLSEYFSGARKTFSLPLKPSGTEFEKSVWLELQNIPHGRSISYEELAIRLGDIKKIRAAGRANGKNPIPIIIPCHRIIGKDGSMVGFSGGIHRKEWLLTHEGVLDKQYSIF